VTDLQDLFHTIEQLPPEELQKLYQFVGQRFEEINGIRRAVGTPEERIAALERGFAELRKDLSEEELSELAAAMNEEYIETEDEI